MTPDLLPSLPLPSASSAAPRAAASLIVVRDGANGLEVLMLRRAQRDGDQNSSAVVFPGGLVDAGDGADADDSFGLDDAAASARLSLPAGGLRFFMAAIRECFEEAGLLIAVDGTDAPADLTGYAPVELRNGREALHDGRASIAELCRKWNVRPGIESLEYYSHWITPLGLPKIFDTRFFVTEAPAGQLPLPDGNETVESFWIKPRDALEQGLRLMTVTEVTLRELSAFSSAEEVVRSARARKDIATRRPRIAEGRRGKPLLSGDAAFAEVGRLDPFGKGTASAELVPGRPVWLSPHVMRVSAANGNAMTGPGTNSYFVGVPGGEWALIDPGPALESHLSALKAAVPGTLTRILVTHTHKDHSPGWAEMKASSGATTYGRIADFPAWQDETFVPDIALAGGERIRIGEGVTLRALRTPGHASNHICYLFEEEKTLFTGDHIMQGTTVVINPPDGNMATYIDSLNLLLAQDLEWLAPGHGFLIDAPHAEVRRTVSHRLAREAMVLADVRQHGPAKEADILARVYARTARALHKVAARSLRAHLEKLGQDGALIEVAEQTWQ